MTKYRVRVEFAAIETITYEVEVEDETKLDFVLNDLEARGEHEAAIELGRMIDADPNSGRIISTEQVIVQKRPELKIVE